jgi:hypothetical protein
LGYKKILWEEIFASIQHLKIGYNDVLNMPTNERRFYLGLLVKQKSEEREQAESARRNSSSNGKRTKTISGEALKQQIRSGDVPLT